MLVGNCRLQNLQKGADKKDAQHRSYQDLRRRSNLSDSSPPILLKVLRLLEDLLIHLVAVDRRVAVFGE